MATLSLQAALERQYRMAVIADPDGGFVVEFPDLPGCITQIDSLDELAAMATEAKALWMETTLAQGLPIPDPTYPEPLSGKFNVRLPKSLHRALVTQAEAEGVSLNQLVVHLLSNGNARAKYGTEWAQNAGSIRILRETVE